MIHTELEMLCNICVLWFYGHVSFELGLVGLVSSMGSWRPSSMPNGVFWTMVASWWRVDSSALCILASSTLHRKYAFFKKRIHSQLILVLCY
jgi:hypothetical protein